MSMRTHRWTKASALFLTAATLSLGSPPAHAQIAPPGAEASKNADELFRKGKDYYKTGKLRDAYQAYRGAWELKQSYDIAANLANTELLLGMKRDAAEHFAACLWTFAATGSKAQQEVVKKQFEEARKDIGALMVKVSVDGAEVFVDGKSMGRAPLKIEVFVEAGARTVEAKLSGYEPAKQTVQVVKGAAPQKVALTLVEVKAAPVEPGTKPLEPVASENPEAGGSSAPAVGEGSAPPPVGPPPDRLRASGRIELSAIFAKPNRPVLIAGAAAAGAALLSGVVFTILANGKASDAEVERDRIAKARGENACGGAAMPADCQALHGLWADRATFSNVAVWSFLGVGALGAATVAVTLVRSKQASESSGVSVTPAVGPGAAGVSVRGVW
jgi:hypothetical protein